MCGGTSLIAFNAAKSSGLSPRVRGNRVVSGLAGLCSGSIPACAGEPRSAATRYRGPWVYPRVCGGTTAIAKQISSEGGLSPRVRGNPASMNQKGRCIRSIPACAGEPSAAEMPTMKVEVYPRVCGGTISPCSCRRRVNGLSPRVRGNPAAISQQTAELRSIPACAGEPDSVVCAGNITRVYPRVCGGTTAWQSQK